MSDAAAVSNQGFERLGLPLSYLGLRVPCPSGRKSSHLFSQRIDRVERVRTTRLGDGRRLVYTFPGRLARYVVVHAELRGIT